ncbi:MDR family MFS transporter [Paenibacillus thailandensis]|uniref:MDR family MFS transporter n=1 Tax=Paenibacillus thailandensis TaxID=393250 RepID=A0ABW5QUA3_9BACL
MIDRWSANARLFIHSYHPIVHSLLLGTILARIASSMSMPFLAIYLMNHTDLNAGTIGLVLGASALAGTVGGFVGGALSDKFGRRKILLGALFGWCLVFFGFAGTHHVILLFILCLLNGLCRSFYEPVSQALMSDLTEKERRFKVFSLRYLAINIGVSVGPLLGALFALLDSTLPFIVTGCIYLVYGTMLFLLMNRFGIKRIEGERKGSSLSASWQAVRHDKVLRFYLLGAVVTSMSYSQMDSNLSQYVGGEFERGVALFALMMSVNAVTVVILQVPLSKWAEKVSPITGLTVGACLYAIGNVGYAFSESWTAFIGSMVVFTLGEILAFPASNLLVDRIAPSGMRGTYYGAQSLSNLGAFMGPWVGGLLLSHYGGRTLFLVMAAIALLALLFYRRGEAVRGQTSITANESNVPV